MNHPQLPCLGIVLGSTSADDLAKVREVERRALEMPQLVIDVQHWIHAGIYQRTCSIPAGAMITGAHIKVPTTLIVSGDCHVFVGGNFVHVQGYRVFAAEANRKQIFIANTETFLTMAFPTDAESVTKAEEQFTDEWHLLTTRNHGG